MSDKLFHLKVDPSKYNPATEEFTLIKHKHNLETTGNLMLRLIKITKTESGLKKINAAFRREHIKNFRSTTVAIHQLQPILSEILGEDVEPRQVQKFISDVQWTHTDQIKVEDFIERLKVLDRFHMQNFFPKELDRDASTWSGKYYLQASTQPRCNYYADMELLRAQNETHQSPEHKTFNKYLNY